MADRIDAAVEWASEHVDVGKIADASLDAVAGALAKAIGLRFEGLLQHVKKQAQCRAAGTS